MGNPQIKFLGIIHSQSDAKTEANTKQEQAKEVSNAYSSNPMEVSKSEIAENSVFGQNSFNQENLLGLAIERHVAPAEKDAVPEIRVPLSPDILQSEKLKNSDKSKTVAVSRESVAEQTGFSREFVDHVIEMEGFEHDVYKDSNGFKTIGIGHNIDADPKYKYGKHISDIQAYTLLKNDLLDAKEKLGEMVDTSKLSRGQQQALVDLMFNVGQKSLAKSNLIKDINEGHLDKAVSEFNYVCTNGSKVNTHLCERRIVNLRDFSDGMEDKKPVYDAMKTLYNKAQGAYDEKLKSAKSKQEKMRILKDKSDYNKRLGLLIDSCKPNMNGYVSEA
ncbi:glycoside hydrolase family protein [bacterium]|nr:glycoside hydrolase family protein [bacterium]